jgi:hypothetical protein
MTKLILTLAVLVALVFTADAQSFYKKHRKFKRAYMAKAITGAVNAHHPNAYNEEISNFGTAGGSIEDYRDNTPRSVRHSQRRAERAARREARLMARAERKMHRDEEKALGPHLVADFDETHYAMGR